MRYAILGGQVKNGAREMEGGFNDLLDVADSVDDLKQKFMFDDVVVGIVSRNETTKKLEFPKYNVICKRFYLKHEKGIANDDIITTYPVDWYQIVDLIDCVVIESFCDDDN